MNIPENWLEEFNRKAAASGVPHISRPFMALSEWTRINNCSIVYGSPEADAVFDWFYKQSPKGAHAIGSLYTGTLYYDAYFWPVEVPISYGTVQFHPLESLRTMPEAIKRRLKADSHEILNYISLWADCVDYGYGSDDIPNMGALKGFALELFTSADENLRATVNLLRERRPNSKAMETARFGTEMFLKAHLAARHGLTPKTAKHLGHDLKRLLAVCLQNVTSSDLAPLSSQIEEFAAVGERYQGRKYDPAVLWKAYAMCQFAGTTLVREFTDRDIRNHIQTVHQSQQTTTS